MHLTIIIPAWNEAGKIGADVERISHFISEINYSTELIIVDDGSEDCTSQIAEKASVSDSMVFKVIRYSPHHGKGYAVRKGISESSGDYVMFLDSGGNIPTRFIDLGLKMIEQNNYDISIGSRYLPESMITKKLIWYRQVTSTLFRVFVKRYLNLPSYITDTQCGFKFYRGDIARELFKECQSDGFIFDLEIILLALEKGHRICEIPIEWACDRDSRLSLVSSFVPIFRELLRLKKHSIR